MAKGKEDMPCSFVTLLPNPSTGSANPSVSLPALWGYLQPALDHIVRSPTNNAGKAPAVDVAYHMGVHTAIYNYFTSQSESIPSHLSHNAPSAQSDKGRPNGIDLYEHIDRYYADVAREIFLGAPHDDASLVHYLVPCFNRYAAGAQSVNRLLNYVNRHYVKRAVDEDKGWLRLADIFDDVAKTIQENDSKEQIQSRLHERRTEELKKWGYIKGDPHELQACAEACAEAASTPDRVVPLSSLAYRRFRIEVIDSLLIIPRTRKGRRKKPSAAKGAVISNTPKGRLARAVKDLLEGQCDDPKERDRVAGELGIALRTVGIRVDHPLRRKLDRYIVEPCLH